MTSQRFVIIGGDAAGMSAASLVKRRLPDWSVEAFEMGDYTSYGACGMPYYISGDIPDLNDLVVVTPKVFKEKRGINVFTRHRAEKIHPREKTVEVRDLDQGLLKEVPYDQLLIATGAEPIVPPGLDLSLPGVFTLRGLPDAAGIKQFVADNSCRQGLIIGAGYIGLEMAEALSRLGLEVTVVDLASRVMEQYEEEISSATEEELRHNQVQVVTGAAAGRIEKTDAGRLKMLSTDGQSFTSDLIVLGAGVKPRSLLAEEAGLELGDKRAIKVDRTQRTSAGGIWAAGDCAEVYHLLLRRNVFLPLALHANRAGRICAQNLIGQQIEFPGVLGTAVCKVFELTVARTGLGLSQARSEGLDVSKVSVTSGSRAHYYPDSAPITTVLIVEKSNQRLWGAQMAGLDGVAQRINTYAAAISAGMTLEQIYNLDLAYAPPFSPVWDPVLRASEVAMKKV